MRPRFPQPRPVRPVASTHVCACVLSPLVAGGFDAAIRPRQQALRRAAAPGASMPWRSDHRLCIGGPVHDETEMEDAETRVATAPVESAGARVDAWLATLWPDLSRSRLQGLIGAGKLTVDGAPVTHAKDKTRAGARYELTLPPPEPAQPQPEALPLTIVFEDEHLIVRSEER